MLFHLSEESDIQRFEPRPSKYTDDPVVWAIDAEHLRNYLLPRDCPRVTYYAGPATTSADRHRFLGPSSAVVAVEERWVERIQSCRLYRYHLPSETFECLDDCAGYFVSRVPVVPVTVEVLDDLIGELFSQSVELRYLPELWTLGRAVAESTLQFSLIRMNKAVERDG